MSPLIVLLAGFLCFVTAAVILWPDKGFLSRWKKSKISLDRIMVEDTLKHLYDFESAKHSITVKSVSLYLSVAGTEAMKILVRMENMGLVSSDSGTYHLTKEGYKYALKVIRIHRLWERYLADETSIPETEWHPEAEEKEHIISPSEADMLAAHMGNPLRDPHGDPIPSASGEVKKVEGILLLRLKAGDFAEIVHIEDEPEDIYSRISELGLYPGMKIRMIESEKDKIIFEADGGETVLAAKFAENVTVRPISIEAHKEGGFIPLSDLSVGEEGVVVGISKLCRGQQRRRLMDFGIVPGSLISAEMKSVSGDPVAYKIRGAKVALRKKHTNQIFIRKKESEKKESEISDAVS